MRSIPPRILGAVLLAASAGSTLVHRSVYAVSRHAPARPVEFALATLTLVLASTGILLIIHGARIFAPGGRVPATRRGVEPVDLQSRLTEPVTPAGRAFDTRRGVSFVQARHAIAKSRIVLRCTVDAESQRQIRYKRSVMPSRR